jgi:hypothetical protein
MTEELYEKLYRSLEAMNLPIVIHALVEDTPDKILVKHHKQSPDTAEGYAIVNHWYKLERKAEKIIVANGATGHCKCGSCGGLIGAWDNYCRHCGAKLEPEDPHLMRGGADE